MAAITKIHKTPIGEFVIKFSIRTGYFEIENPTNLDEQTAAKLRHDCIKRNYKLRTWDDVNAELKSIVDQFRHEFLLTRRVIILQVRTSASTHEYDKPNHWDGRVEKKKLDHMDDAEGFQIKWYVADEYQYPNSKHLYYKITDTNPNNRHRRYYLKESQAGDRDHTNILPQLIGDDDGSLRVFDYTDELYAFLQDIQKSIDGMLKRMVDYFGVDPQKFLENISNQMKLLAPAPDISEKP